MAQLWPLFSSSGWAQPATVVAGTASQGAVLTSVPSVGMGQSSARLFCARHDRGSLNYCRTSEQMQEQRPHLSFPLPQKVAAPTLTNRTEARSAPSTVVPAFSEAGGDYAVQSNRGKGRALSVVPATTVPD